MCIGTKRLSPGILKRIASWLNLNVINFVNFVKSPLSKKDHCCNFLTLNETQLREIWKWSFEFYTHQRPRILSICPFFIFSDSLLQCSASRNFFYQSNLIYNCGVGLMQKETVRTSKLRKLSNFGIQIRNLKNKGLSQ